MISNLTRRHRRSGYSLTEITLAIAAMAIVGPIMMIGLMRISTLVVSMTERAEATQTARVVMSDARRGLLGAAPLGHCLDNLTASSGVSQSELNAYNLNNSVRLADCRRVAAYNFSIAFDPTGGARSDMAVQAATSSGLCVWAHATSTASVAAVPDQVCFSVDNQDRLVLRRFAPATGSVGGVEVSYTTPYWNTTRPVTVAYAGTVASDDVFSYYDAKGCRLSPQGPGGSLATSTLSLPDCGSTASQVSRVAMVEMHPTFTYKTPGNNSASFTRELYVQFSGASAGAGR